MLGKLAVLDPEDVGNDPIAGQAVPEKRPWRMTWSPLAAISPASCLKFAGRDLIKSNSPARPGAMCALCWI